LLSKPFEGNKTRVCPNDKQANGKLQTKSPEDGPPAHLHSIQIMFLLTTTKKEKGTKTHLKKKKNSIYSCGLLKPLSIQLLEIIIVRK